MKTSLREQTKIALLEVIEELFAATNEALKGVGHNVSIYVNGEGVIKVYTALRNSCRNYPEDNPEKNTDKFIQIWDDSDHLGNFLEDAEELEDVKKQCINLCKVGNFYGFFADEEVEAPDYECIKHEFGTDRLSVKNGVIYGYDSIKKVVESFQLTKEERMAVAEIYEQYNNSPLALSKETDSLFLSIKDDRHDVDA